MSALIQRDYLERELYGLRRELASCERAPLDRRVADEREWMERRARLREEVARCASALEAAGMEGEPE